MLCEFYLNKKKLQKKNANLTVLIPSLKSVHWFPIVPEAPLSCSLPSPRPHFRAPGPFAFGSQLSFPQSLKGTCHVSHLPRGFCTDCSFCLKISCFTLCMLHGAFQDIPNHVKTHIALVLFLLSICPYLWVCVHACARAHTHTHTHSLFD